MHKRVAMNTEHKNYNDDEMEARLWAYLDGQSEEASEIEDLLQENKTWKEKYGELLELQTLIRQTELEQPSMRFTKNVMEDIAKYSIAPAAKAYINKNVIRGIAAFFITVIVGFLGYGLSQLTWSDAGTGNNGFSVDLGTMNYSRMFNNTALNGFLMLNVVLSLFLLDRFLTLKRKKRMEG